MSDSILKDVHIDCVQVGLSASNREQVIRTLSSKIADRLSFSAYIIANRLIEREKQASSAIGDGVAIMQMKMRQIGRPYLALATLKKPVNFGAPDMRGVDIVCLLLSPEIGGASHLQDLFRLTRQFRDRDFCERLREIGDEEVLRAVLKTPDGWTMAA